MILGGHVLERKVDVGMLERGGEDAALLFAVLDVIVAIEEAGEPQAAQGFALGSGRSGSADLEGLLSLASGFA